MTTPDSHKSSLTNKDWYAIACKIRTQNQQLKQEISELKTFIEEQKKQIKDQVIENKKYESKIQELEIAVNHSHIPREEQNEQYQKQKMVIENLTKELKKTQQLAANLERDCSLLQDSYNECQYLLKQKEKENKELQVRLQRQQRYNAQYKTALDHYLTNSDTPKEVNSLGIKSWSDDNLSTDNSFVNGNSLPVDSTPEIPNFLDKIDREIAEIDRNLQDNRNKITSSEISEVQIKSQENISEDQEISKPEEKENKKKPRNQSFLKLPKFGK